MGDIWEQIRSASQVLAAFIRTHGRILDDEPLRTLMGEVEAVVNSRHATVDAIIDADSQIPISPSNTSTMRSNVLIPPPGNFKRPDLYSRSRWCQVLKEFWSRWRKGILVTLQYRTKQKGTSRNFQIGNVVLLQDNQVPNQYPMT